MNSFFKESLYDFGKKALNENIKKTPPIDLQKAKQKEFDLLESRDYERLDDTWREHGLSVFDKINPEGLPLVKVKEKLEDEISELRMDLADLRNHPEKIANLSDQEKSDLYDKYSRYIANRLDWISQIDDFLLTQDSAPFSDLKEEEREKLQEKWKNIEEVDPGLN